MRDYADANGGGGAPTTPVNPSVEVIGFPCGNTWASHYGTPTVGAADFGIVLSGAASYGQAFLTISGQGDNWQGIPLPLNLDHLGMFGCNVWVGDGLVTQGSANGQGSVALPVLIPNIPALAGQDFFFQWLAPKFGENPANLVLSQGLRAVIGS